MKDRVKINDAITVGRQPSEATLQLLADEGFRTIINIRAENEPHMLMRPQEEREIVETIGMAYRHFPISATQLDEAMLDQFREVLMDAPKPAYVHDETGVRSGILVLAESTAKLCLRADDCFRVAKHIGISNIPNELETKIRVILDVQAPPRKAAA